MVSNSVGLSATKKILINENWHSRTSEWMGNADKTSITWIDFNAYQKLWRLAGVDQCM
jgi:hypothetical protein